MAATVYREPAMLWRQVRDVLNFYHPACLDDRFGGYVAQLDERTGHVYDGETKHLVATARAVHNFSLGAALGGPDWCRPAAERGLTFLANAHWDADREGYDWLLAGRETVDDTRYCYGHAFVLLAAARAVEAGIPGARRELDRAFGVIDEQFWEPDRGLCADRADGDWSELASYRGQNANMHACEAMLAAHEATGEAEFLDRAYRIADSFVREVASQTDDLLWEHYTEAWEPDLSYNRDEPRHQFRPWGYQPGHHAEWAKLLLVLDRHRPEEWPAERARELFDAATDWWDDEYGGFYYTVEADGEPVVADKYGWAVAEAIGAAALLSERDDDYLAWYDRLWAYADEHFVNPKYGNWYERLSRENERDGPNRGTAVEPGYHPLNNAVVAMESFERRAE
ncbi:MULTISPECIES: AGE family epimerase/isomerase [Halorussus]|uniref:AGE family epimerase/isomerase n=1 Tax=Halorussus TaxID=1070314 RepID=UPI000E2115D8|nr:MULTISPECIES: AGE family epimerase/isomerase [Halorussus]NHN58442.1 AGE family epimerase/isomerase [Halorussus sp. JP-T4]